MLWRVEYEVHDNGLKQARSAFVDAEEQTAIFPILAREANRDVLVRRIELVGMPCYGGQQHVMWRDPAGPGKSEVA